VVFWPGVICCFGIAFPPRRSFSRARAASWSASHFRRVFGRDHYCCFTCRWITCQAHYAARRQRADQDRGKESIWQPPRASATRSRTAARVQALPQLHSITPVFTQLGQAFHVGLAFYLSRTQCLSRVVACVGGLTFDVDWLPSSALTLFGYRPGVWFDRIGNHVHRAPLRNPLNASSGLLRMSSALPGLVRFLGSTSRVAFSLSRP